MARPRIWNSDAERKAAGRDAERKAGAREAAIEHGRQLGEDGADRRGETGDDREQRAKRAMAYAAWDFDGKPESSQSQREELGAVTLDVTPSLERAAPAGRNGRP